jgi:tRNA modification GTPase
LTLYFPSPNSYTGEDLAEFHVHGSTAVIRAVLDAIGSCDVEEEGKVRYAEPGEFTRRAFDNERLDLTQIEGIGKLLVAETEEQRRAAMRQAEVQSSLTKAHLQGGLKVLYNGWREDVIKCRAMSEAIIDFGEDEGIEDEIYGDGNGQENGLS